MPNSFAAAQAAASQVGADTVIEPGGGDQVSLVGNNLASLDADDFLFTVNPGLATARSDDVF